MNLLPASLSPPLLLLLIGVLVVLIIVLMLIVLWRTKTKQDAAVAEPPQEAPPETESAPAPETALEKKETRPIVREGQTSSSVSAAMHFLQENSAGLGGRYRTPWFLVLGAAGSGKSTLMEHSGIGLSLREGATDFGVSNGIQWRFFDAGVILDIPGEFFIRADHTGSDERGFKTLLRNLVKHRPQRPIDGVVLTIPCTELFGENAVGPAAVGQRASRIFDKLWMVEKWVGLSFPVYVVITKCDVIPGFGSLARQLPARYRREMFGWSNPYNVEAAFEPGWIDQGFGELARELNRLQSEVFVEHHEIPDVDGVFLFSSRLDELKTPLRHYLGHIFKPTAYRESLQFRGFYFTGDAPTEVIEVIEPQRALVAAASASSSLETESDYLSVPGDVLGLTSVPHAQPHAVPIFVTDLFEGKIFPERSLARPVSRVRLFRSRSLMMAQAACLIAVLVLAAGVWLRYGKLARARNEFVPMLNSVYDELTKIKNSPGRLTQGEEDSANYLVRTVQATTGGFRTFFYPTSLVAPLESRLERALVPVFQELVYKSFRQQLLNKGQLLGTGGPGECAQNSAGALGQLDSYQRLCAFTNKLLLLETNIDTYNTVTKVHSGDVHQLAHLEAFLSGNKLDENLKEHTRLFDLALDRAVGEPIQRTDLNRSGATNTMRALTQGLFEEWFAENPVLLQLDTIRDKIDELDDAPTAADLIELDTTLKKVSTEMANPEFAWVGGNAFQLTPQLNDLTNGVVAKSRYFLYDQSDSLRDFVNDVGKSEFGAFRSKRDSENTTLTGPLLRVEAGSTQLTESADKLRVYLDDLIKQPFAQHDRTDELKPKGSGQQLIWNKNLLDQAATFKDPYQHFTKETLVNVPSELRETFEIVALGRLADAVMELAAQSERLEPLPASEDPEVSIVPELLSFQDAAPDLNTLLEQLQELELTTDYEELLKISARQASGLLARIDASFEAQAPYASSGPAFTRWTGETPASWAGFEVHNSDEVSQYILFQRQQAQQYATKAAVLVSFLETRTAAGGKDTARLVNKWRGIVDDLQKYNAKVPGTSLASLEDFIGVEAGKATPDNCQVDFLATPLSGSNYFAQRQESLRRSLYGRCRYLSEQNAVRQYAAIAKLFNNQLAGKFPFAAPPQEQLPSEADPADIEKLYGMLDSYGKSIRNGLQKGDFGDSYALVLNFLNQMDGLRPLFNAFLAGPPEAAPAFDFVPLFRVNQGREINGNEIIDWTLQVGTENFRYRDPERTGRWNFGDPVKLALRWAKDSPQRPASVRTPDDTKLNARTVTFEYRDSWSLLRMILLHRPAPTDFDRMVDPDPQTLVFTAADTTSANPRAANGDSSTPQTKVFVRIRLRAPGKPDNLRLHSFPTEAPELGQAQARSMNAGGNSQ